MAETLTIIETLSNIGAIGAVVYLNFKYCYEFKFINRRLDALEDKKNNV